MSQIADLRNVATVERLSKELLKQCGHFRYNTANNHDDRLRFLILERYAWDLLRVTQQGMKRYDRSRANPEPVKVRVARPKS